MQARLAPRARSYAPQSGEIFGFPKQRKESFENTFPMLGIQGPSAVVAVQVGYTVSDIISREGLAMVGSADNLF